MDFVCTASRREEGYITKKALLAMAKQLKLKRISRLRKVELCERVLAEQKGAMAKKPPKLIPTEDKQPALRPIEPRDPPLKRIQDKNFVSDVPTIQILPLNMGPCQKEKYTILETLGEGTFGKVSLAQKGPQISALKEIKVNEADIVTQQNVINELMILKELQCIPTKTTCIIPKIYDIFQCKADGFVTYYVSMEVIPDVLSDYVSELDKLRYPRRLEVVYKLGLNLAKAIAQLHNVGLLHLDLKPANIGIGRKTLKLLDFGFSCMANKFEPSLLPNCVKDFDSWRNIGTEGFTPANLFGDQYDIETYDYYAWVMIMYYLLKGKHIDTIEDHKRAYDEIRKEAKEAVAGSNGEKLLKALMYGLVPFNQMSFVELVERLHSGEYEEYELEYSEP